MNRIKLMLGVLALSLLVYSCKRGNPTWDTDMLVPLVTSSVSMSDILQDSLIEADNDSALRLVYQNSVYSLDLSEDLIALPDTTLEKSVKLDSLKLSDKTITYAFTMGMIARGAGGIVETLIKNNHGGTAIIFPLSNLSSDTVDVDGTDFFETATMDSGYLDIKIENGLEIAISNLEFEIWNKVSGVLIVNHTFPFIAPGASDSITVDLAGRTMEGELQVQIKNMDTPGSGGVPVPIDTNDALLVTMEVRDVQLYEATAVFPAQNLLNLDQSVPYQLGGPLLTTFLIREGDLNVEVQSTVEDTITFEYKMFGATSPEGDTLAIETKVDPAPSGGSISVFETYDLKGYTMDLTGKDHDTVNTLYSNIKARIDSTGNLVFISLEDSVLVKYTLSNIKAEYAEGFLGQFYLPTGPEYIDLDLFKNVRSGELDLEQVDVSLEVTNELGIQAGFVINDFTSINSRTGNEISLVGDLPNQLIHISAATDNPLTPSNKLVGINSVNSNITELVENIPDKMRVYLDVFINLHNKNPSFNDFVYWGQSVNLDLNIEMPLSFYANQLILVDTVPFKFENTESTQRVIGGKLRLKALNGFPLDADIQLLLFDEDWNYIDSLFTNTAVKGCEVDAACKATDPIETILEVPINPDRFDRFQRATRAILVAGFNSDVNCGSDYPKIYSSYRLDVNVSGDFIYGLGKRE